MARKEKTLDEIINSSNNEKVLFCKECEEVGLNEFGLDPTDKDAFKRALEQHKICKEIGRFKGEVCSRVFIASDELPTFDDDDNDIPQ
jgi:hypothetical protein